jgi:hypothetical protein
LREAAELVRSFALPHSLASASHKSRQDDFATHNSSVKATAVTILGLESAIAMTQRLL